MFCVKPIINLKNSNFSAGQVNSRQSRINATPADSVCFGNAMSRQNQLADVFQTLVMQSRKGATTVNKSLLEMFMHGIAALAKDTIKTAEANFPIEFPRATKTLLADSATVVNRKFAPGSGDIPPRLSYRITMPLMGERYPKGTYLLVTATIDDANIAQSKAYNLEAPHSFFVKIGHRSNVTWKVTNAGVIIPAELNRADFDLHLPKRTEIITLA